MRAVFFLPILSEIGPKINCPPEIPKKTVVMIQYPCCEVTSKYDFIIDKAGSIVSILNAPKAIRLATNNTILDLFIYNFLRVKL